MLPLCHPDSNDRIMFAGILEYHSWYNRTYSHFSSVVSSVVNEKIKLCLPDNLLQRGSWLMGEEMLCNKMNSLLMQPVLTPTVKKQPPEVQVQNGI